MFKKIFLVLFLVNFAVQISAGDDGSTFAGAGSGAGAAAGRLLDYAHTAGVPDAAKVYASRLASNAIDDVNEKEELKRELARLRAEKDAKRAGLSVSQPAVVSIRSDFGVTPLDTMKKLFKDNRGLVNYVKELESEAEELEGVIIGLRKELAKKEAMCYERAANLNELSAVLTQISADNDRLRRGAAKPSVGGAGAGSGETQTARSRSDSLERWAAERDAFLADLDAADAA